MRARSLGGVLVLVASLVACSGKDDDSNTAESPETTLPEPSAGAPAVCDSLIADVDVRGLDERLRSVTVDGGETDELSASAEALREYEPDFPAAGQAAAALEALADAPDDAQTIEALADAFSALDAEVQAACDFPLS